MTPAAAPEIAITVALTFQCSTYSLHCVRPAQSAGESLWLTLGTCRDHRTAHRLWSALTAIEDNNV